MAKSKTVSLSKRDEEVKINRINGGRPIKACIVHSDDFSYANRGLSMSPETVKASAGLSPRPSTLNQSKGRQDVFEMAVTNDDHHNLHYNYTQDDNTCLMDLIRDQRNAAPTGRQEVFGMAVINDDHHNLHYNNTQDDDTCLIDPKRDQRNATPTERQEVFEMAVNNDDHHNLHYNNTQDDDTCLIDPIRDQRNATPTLTERIIPYKLIALTFVVGIVIASLIVIPVIVISINKDTANNDATRCLDDTWGKWSQCSKSCGQGVQIRMKGCSYGIDNTDSRQCANKSCEIDLPKCLQEKWSSWTKCSTSCGQGVQTRVKCSYGVNKTDSKECSIRSCKEGVCHFSLILDQSTRHALCYLSTDNHVVSNYYSLETPVRPQSVHQLKNFQGVIGKPCIKPGWIAYYEIGYSYKIISNAFINMGKHKHVEMVLDFGLAAKDHVDDNRHIGYNDQEWAFSMYKCSSSNKICFSAINNAWGYREHQLSDMVLGKSQNGTFGVFVNRLRQEISLIDIQQESILYRLSYVKTDKDLCPVFGAGYNVRAVESSIKLLDSRLLFQQSNDSITFCKGSIFHVFKGLL